MWSQFFGGAIILTLAQTVFVNLLKSALHSYVPSLDAGRIISAGATGYAAVVPKEYRTDVEQAYNKAIVHTFYLGVAVAAISLITSLGLGALKANTSTKTETTRSKPAAIGDAEK